MESENSEDLERVGRIIFKWILWERNAKMEDT
jgi:hypothetical protein